MEPIDISLYIKAITSKGGEYFDLYSRYDTPENAKAFDRWLGEQKKVSNLSLYRGYCFDAMYWNDANVTAGSVIDMNAMTQSANHPAFTSSVLRAVRYMREIGEGVGLTDNVSVLFEVETKGVSFVDISRLSYYPEENEYRFPKSSMFVVNSVINKGGYIKVNLKERK